MPVANLLGQENQGFNIAMAGINGGRVNIGSAGIGSVNMWRILYNESIVEPVLYILHNNFKNITFRMHYIIFYMVVYFFLVVVYIYLYSL